MVNPAGRRKVKKRRSRGEKAGIRWGFLAAGMLLAILLGYLTARFVIGPIIGYNADESPIKAEDSSGSDEDKAEKAEETASDDSADKAEETGEKTDATASAATIPEKGYALQFGAFSTKEAAEELSKALMEKGIETEIVEADSVFKVITPVIDEKTEALKALEDVKDKEVADVFIASFG